MYTAPVPRARDWLLVPALFAVAAIGLAWGGRSTYRAVRNPSPKTMTCADFLAHPGSADWVRLEGCAAASDHIGIEQFKRSNEPTGGPVLEADAVYIPLDVSGERLGGDIALLLRVDHGPILRLGSSFATEQEARAADEALAQPIEGMVERALDRSARDRDKLRDLGLRLSDDFIVIDYGERPRPLWLGLGVFAVGFGALTLLVRKWRRRARPVEIPKAKLVTG